LQKYKLIIHGLKAFKTIKLGNSPWNSVLRNIVKNAMLPP